MSPEEYLNLEKIESRHWFYVGKRLIVKYWIEKFVKINQRMSLIDCGAGAGAFAMHMADVVSVEAMDDHKESLEILRKKLPRKQVIEGSCTAIPLPNESRDIVTALDVLEHIHNDKTAASELLRILRPGGLVVVTVPALMSLWSDWDESLHHQRRYKKNELLSLFSELPCIVEHCAYINVMPLPLIWLIRKFRALGIARNNRVEDKIPFPLLNWILKECYVRLAISNLQFPFGVGLLLVARKQTRSKEFYNRKIE
jgi:SAM-dependent methyltransferase